MPNPTISVVIPTYNRATYIPASIDSVIGQSNPPDEIIVVDDGSTDNTSEVLQAYKNKIKCIFQQNLGVSAARNAGLSVSKGEWVAFLDSDDEWRSNHLLHLARLIEAHPGAVAYLTNMIIHDTGLSGDYFAKRRLNDLLPRNSDSTFIAQPLYDVIKYNISFIITALMNRETVVRVGLFDEALTIFEDFDLLVRMAAQGPLVLSNCITVDKHRREESTENLTNQMITSGLRARRSFVYIYKKILKNDGLAGKERRLISRTLSHDQRALANHLLLNVKIKEARKSFREAFLSYPSIKSATKYLLALLPLKLSRILIPKKGQAAAGEDVQIGAEDMRSTRWLQP